MPKQKTEEEYILQLREKNPTIKLMGHYVNNNTKITHKCLICGYEWQPTPSNLLSGHKCPECKRLSMVQRGFGSLKRGIEDKNPTVTIISEYKGLKSKIKVKCKVCEHEWEINPQDLVRRTVKCPCCKERKRIKKKHRHIEYKTPEKVLSLIETKFNGKIILLEKITKIKQRVKFKCLDCGRIYEREVQTLLNKGCPFCNNIYKKRYYDKLRKYNLEILEEYKGVDVKILHKCLLCGNVFSMIPSNLPRIKERACPNCRGWTLEKYNEEVHKIFPNLTAYGEFKNIYSPVHIKCSTCGTSFIKQEARSVLRGIGCLRCSWNRKRLTHEQFIDRLSLINPDITPLEKYIKGEDKITFKCNRCGKTFRSRPRAILEGEGCPWCTKSKKEKIIQKFLEDNQVFFLAQHSFSDCKNKKLLKFDFYLPNLNLCIEYDGKQHYFPVDYFGGIRALKEIQKRDQIKNEYCREHHIDLLRIKYDVSDEDLYTTLSIWANSKNFIADLQNYVNDIEYMEYSERSLLDD